MKRVWTEVRVAPAAAGFAILLDGKPLQLQGAEALAVRHEALARAIAEEWRLLPPVFAPEALIFTRLALVPQDDATMHSLRGRLAAYGASDLLCYRAAEDRELAAREAQVWDKWLDWAAAALGACLETGHGISPVPQPPGAQEALRAALAQRNGDELVALQMIVPALGSLILGLAIVVGALLPDEACEIGQLDELWQEARWGTDPASAARRAAVQQDVAAAAKFIDLCRA